MAEKMTKRKLDEISVRRYIDAHGNYDYKNYKKFSEARPMTEGDFNWWYKRLFVEEWNSVSSTVTEAIAKEKLKAMVKGLSGYNPAKAKKIGKNILCSEYGHFDGDKTLISFEGNVGVKSITDYCKVRNKKTYEIECMIYKVDTEGVFRSFMQGPFYVVIDREGQHIRKSTAFIQDAYQSTGSLRKTYEVIH